MRSLKWLLLVLVSFIFHSGIAIAYVPPPEPPDRLYRIDYRAPEDVFSQGFRPWSTQSTNPNEYLLDHITGVSVRDRNTSWVSASGSRQSVEYTIMDLARQRERFPSHVWVYEISPTQDSFDVNWVVEDALEELDELPYTPGIVYSLRNYSRAFHRQNEWATRSGFQSQQIHQAVRYDLTEGNWVRTSEVRTNPGYNPGPRPHRQRTNPITQQRRLEQLPVQGYEIEWFAVGMAAFARWISLGESCEGVVGLWSNNRNRNHNDLYCDMDLVQQVPIPTKEQLSKLYVIDHLKETLCWGPSLSGKWSGTYHFVFNLQLANCDSVSDGLAEYDELQRLVYYWGGVEFCVTAPATVSQGSSNWDWITLEPCVTNNPRQVWDIYKGKIYLLGTRMYIQDWKYYAIISGKNTGYDNSLDESKMPPKFFTEPSPVKSLMLEIGLGWRWKGTTYYPNDNNSQPWGTVYSKRTFYDALTQKIVMYTAYSRAFQSDVPQVRCLSSRQVRNGTSPWDWADWLVCRQREATGKEYKFTIKSRSTDIARPVRVIIKDASKDTLWFQATRSNAGFPFTGTWDYSSGSTNDLVVNFSAYSSPFFFYSKGTK